MSKRKQNKENASVSEDNNQFKKKVNKIDNIFVEIQTDNNNVLKEKNQTAEAKEDQPAITTKKEVNELVKSKNSLDDSVNSTGNSEDNEAILEEIGHLVRNAKEIGENSCSGEATQLPAYPGLHINDFGEVLLPFSSDSAQKIIEICKKSSNENEAASTNEFQLEPSSFEIKNREWNEGLKKLVDINVAKGLGCYGEIEAKLYKLLVYQPGGHFKKHRDTEKDKNIFGTLIIQMPSNHKGGELVIYNNDSTRSIHDFGVIKDKAQYSIHYAAHHADVEHEILEVKSGYRIALIYSLCWINGNGFCETKNKGSVEKMANCLNELSKFKYSIGFMLDYKYKPASITQFGINVLTGFDNYRLNLLRYANEKLPSEKQFGFYFGNTNLFIKALCNNQVPLFSFYEANTKENDKNWIKKWGKDYDVLVETSIDNLCRDDGSPFISSKEVLKKTGLEFFTRIFNPSLADMKHDWYLDQYSWGDKRYISVSGFGFQSKTKTTTYSKDCLIIWPKKYEFKYLANISVVYAIQLLHGSLEKKEIELKMMLKCIVEELITDKYDSLEEATCEKIFDIFYKIRDKELINKFLLGFNKNVPVKFLARIIEVFGWDHLIVPLSKILEPSAVKDVYNCDLIKELRRLGDEYSAYSVLKLSIYPLLDNPSRFSFSFFYPYSNNFENERADEFYKLAETLSFFEGEEIEEYMEKYKNIVLLLFKDSLLENLLDKISFNSSIYPSQSILQMYEARLKSLSEKIVEPPKINCWSMPGKIDGYPILNDFLQSEDEEITYRSFSSITTAREFAAIYGNFESSRRFSIKISVKGNNARFYANIAKTKEYYEYEDNEFKKKMSEYLNLKKFIDDNKK